MGNSYLIMGRGSGAEAICLACPLKHSKFIDREKLRIQNRTKRQIYAEMATTSRKLLIFSLIFYALLYTLCLALSAALDSDIDGKEPFDSDACDWTTDRGKAIGISTLASFLLMSLASVVVVREGDLKVYDRVWDFTITLVVLHIILSAAIGGAPTNGQWWGTVIGGGLMLVVFGYLACSCYWDSIAQTRLDGKVNAL